VRNVSSSDGTITFNIGQRAGVSPGALLQVYRLKPVPEYVGILEVESSASDSSSGRMRPQYRQKPVHVGDIVSPEIAGQP
jgi:hypothetical protein